MRQNIQLFTPLPLVGKGTNADTNADTNANIHANTHPITAGNRKEQNMATAAKTFFAACIAALALALTACGGGGGSSQTYTVVCAGGVSKTSNVNNTDYSVCTALATGSLAATWDGATSQTGKITLQTALSNVRLTNAKITASTSIDISGVAYTPATGVMTLSAAAATTASTSYTLTGTLSADGYSDTAISLAITTPAVWSPPSDALVLTNADKSIYNSRANAKPICRNGSTLVADCVDLRVYIKDLNNLPADTEYAVWRQLRKAGTTDGIEVSASYVNSSGVEFGSGSTGVGLNANKTISAFFSTSQNAWVFLPEDGYCMRLVNTVTGIDYQGGLRIDQGECD